MANPISTNSLKPNETVRIRGKLSYGRIVTKIDGDELRDRNKNTRFPVNRPYNTITIDDAKVLRKDPNNPTLFEQWAENGMFKSHRENAVGFSFTATNKGTLNPWIGQRINENQAKQVYPNAELANGLEVTLILRVFKASPNNGVTLAGVIVEEPIKLYSPNSPESIMAEYGIEFITEDNPEQKEETPEPMQEVEPNTQNLTAKINETDVMPPNPLASDATMNTNQGIKYNPQERGY